MYGYDEIEGCNNFINKISVRSFLGFRHSILAGVVFVNDWFDLLTSTKRSSNYFKVSNIVMQNAKASKENYQRYCIWIEMQIK